MIEQQIDWLIDRETELHLHLYTWEHLSSNCIVWNIVYIEIRGTASEEWLLVQ